MTGDHCTTEDGDWATARSLGGKDSHMTSETSC